MYLSKGVSDEDDKVISVLFFQSLEKTKQDKAIDKVGGRISDTTWSHLIRSLRKADSNSLVCQELIRLVKQYNLVDAYPEDFQKQFLLKLKSFFKLGWLLEPDDTKAFTDSHLVCLSLLRIPTEKGEQAIKRSLAEKSYAPLIALFHSIVHDT